MSIPGIQKARIGAYIARQKLTGNGRFPLVLMLEPLFRCNLRCKGCGKITYPDEVLRRHLSVQECVRSVEECGAPVVSIAGGEPLLHPDIHIIAHELTARKRFVYLCTNALLLEKMVDHFDPSPYLTFNVHLDGLYESHDARVSCRGAFDKAISAIRLLISKGFRVTTNTTLFDGETPQGAARLFDFLSTLGVEGMTISPGFCYENASDQKHFLRRDGTKALFRNLFQLRKGKDWRFNHSTLYLDFLAGNQDYACLPWGNPTYNIFGWQRPCYLLNDGYAGTYRELMETTDWTKYGVGKDRRCANCMIHSGFEPTAVMDSFNNPLKALAVGLRGRFGSHMKD